jgi:hypothetical protein
MKHYKICYPDDEGNNVDEILSERDIIKQYFDFWSRRMSAVGKEHLISYENCIEDWVVVNWAEEF